MIARVIALLAFALPAAACAHSYEVEGRETRVNVWLTVPQLAETGGRIDALIYVGPYKAVQGHVVFEKGSPTVSLPPLFIRTGPRDVAAVLEGGRYSVRETIDIEGESWVQIILREGQVLVEYDDEEPDPWGR